MNSVAGSVVAAGLRVIGVAREPPPKIGTISVVPDATMVVVYSVGLPPSDAAVVVPAGIVVDWPGAGPLEGPVIELAPV